MTPYYENALVALFHNKAEHVLPQLNRESFGCIILDPPVSMRQVEEADYVIDMLGLFRVLRYGGIVYTLANPDPGIFVTVKGQMGQRSATLFSPLRNAQPQRLHGHQNARPASAIKGLLMSTTGKILDPYCGIGTTLLMAQELRREAVGVEIEEKFCNTAAQLLAA